MTGLYDANAVVAARNVVKDASTYGAQYQHYDGYDFTVDARMKNGVFIQGGVNTGRTMTDNCAIATQAPEVQTVAGVFTPASYCHFETPYQPLYKLAASYTLPYGVRVAATLQSLPGPQIVANTIFNNASRVASTTLGRPFTLAQVNAQTIAPGSAYGDRMNQIDFRFTKIVRMGSRGNLDLDVDVYNAFNSDAVIGELGSFGPAWRLPLTVIQPRFVKFQVRYDF